MDGRLVKSSIPKGEVTSDSHTYFRNLIRAFGETTIMERIMDGKGLSPLASPTQLVESPLIASYAPIHIATVVDSLSPTIPSKSPSAHFTHDTHALALLKTIILLMQVHGRACFKSWMAILPTILTHLYVKKREGVFFSYIYNFLFFI